MTSKAKKFCNKAENSLAKSILVVGPAWIGDMVMAQTLLMTLKQNNPTCVIDVLAPEWSKALLERMPEVRQAIPLPIGHGQLQLGKRYQMGRALRSEQYQQAIVLPNSFKSALIPFWAKIPKRTGWYREFRWGLLNDMRYLNKKKLPLMIQRFISLGLTKHQLLPTTLPYPKLQAKPSERHRTLEKFHLDSNQAPILALCPGAEYGPAKRWPAEYYAEVAKRKLDQGWQVWLFGSAKDQPLAVTIQQITENRCHDLVGKTQLAEAVDLLSLASAVVTNDSGLMHVAAALERPIVAIYGSSSPTFTPPLTEKLKILSLNLVCSPCFARECRFKHTRCLNDLHPVMIDVALDEIGCGTR